MQSLHRTFISLLVILCCIDCVSQGNADICETNATGIFWPIKTGLSRYYYAQGETSKVFFNGDSLKVGEHIFFKEVTEYKSGERKVAYYREEDGNIYLYDTEKNVAFLELSGNTDPGFTWEKSDKSWKYTVIDTSSSLSTPYCEYKNLLNVKAEPLGDTKKDFSSFFNMFYKRGVGLVGINVAGKPYSFLTVDKSQVIERSYTMAECGELSTEEQRIECTSEKITAFISHNLNYDGKAKKGVIILQLLINKKGEVENVSVKEPLKKAETQTEEAIRVVKLLKFVPRTINGTPIDTWVFLPITF